MWNSIETQENVETLAKEQTGELNNLVVFNDDFNTFDHVIESLIKVCKHEVEQAEQCTWIIHYNGKCEVKMGEYSKLEPMCTALLDRGINAEIH